LAKGIASLFEEVARMPYKNYYLAKSLQACMAMMIMVCSVASLMGQPLVKGPDFSIPVDFTIKIQMKSKKSIKLARTFDNKILEVKDVLNDPTSVYLKGLAEGVATLELISKDDEREELSIFVMRQQTPVNNIKFLKETTIDIAHLKKVLAQAVPNTKVEISLVTTDSVFVKGEVNSYNDMRTILHVASKIVDPSYQEKGVVPGLTYSLKDDEDKEITTVSSKVINGLKLKPKKPIDLNELKKTLKQAVPTGNIDVVMITADSVFISGEVNSSVEQLIVLQLASKIVDPSYQEKGKVGNTYNLNDEKGQSIGTVSFNVLNGIKLRRDGLKIKPKKEIDIEELNKVLSQAVPTGNINVKMITADSVFISGEVNSSIEQLIVLQLASKIVDPGYQEKGREGTTYDLNDEKGQNIGSVSFKVINGLKVLKPNQDAEPKKQSAPTPPTTSFNLDYLKKVITNAVPNSNIQVIPITKDSVILSGYVSRAEDIIMILSIASNIVDPTLFDGLSQSSTTPTNNSGQTNPTNNANGNMSTDSNAAANSQAAQSAPRTSQKVINALRVAGVQQVQLDVVVAQVSRTEFRNLGFNFLSSRNSSFIGSTLSGLSAQPTSMGAGLASGASSGASIGSTLAANGFVASTTGANVPFGVLNSNSGFLGFLQALRIESASKLLAEPKLVTSSGKKASFLVGGEQAVISATSGVNGPGVAFVQIGTRLDFLPVVLGNGKIQLTVNPSIKSVNNDLGIANPSGPGRTPGFDDKQVTATVEMETGQTFVIGGLIQNETRGSTIKMPVLGDLPFLGVLFSSKSFQEVEQEVVILVTPYLVDPQSCDQLPKLLPGQETRSPDDFELFLEGILEAPRGPRKVIQDRRYIPAFKNAKPLDAESGESRVPGNLIFPARNQENPKLKELPIIETQPMPLTLPEVSNSKKTSEAPLVQIKNSGSSLPIKVLPGVANPNNSEPKIKTSSLQVVSPVK
jgi:Flp pilus assembly secretin CpaC